MIFDSEIPGIIKQNGVEYYELNGKYESPNLKGHRQIFLIGIKDNLIYKTEMFNANGQYKNTKTFMNYININGVMIPQKILSNTVDDDGGKYEYETTYNNFTFKDDIPDSLFEIPIDKAPSLDAATKRNTAFQFRTSTAHPEWQSPYPELENRLKTNVSDIVNNYPNRNGLDNSEMLDKLANRLQDVFAAAGARVSRQDVKWEHNWYYLENNRYCNIIASFGPSNGPRVIVGAHYDAGRDDAGATVPGASDNASGVSVILELAKILGKNPPSVRVDLVAYTLEEDGGMGSAAHAKALKAENVEVKAMINIDSVGYFSDEPKSQRFPFGLLKLFYPSRGNFICVMGKSGSGSLIKDVKMAMAGATPLPVKSFKAPASIKSLVYMIIGSDHKAFWDQGYPAVFINDTGYFRNEHYHKETDVPELLDYRRMAMVTVGVEKAIRALCK